MKTSITSDSELKKKKKSGFSNSVVIGKAWYKLLRVPDPTQGSTGSESQNLTVKHIL